MVASLLKRLKDYFSSGVAPILSLLLVMGVAIGLSFNRGEFAAVITLLSGAFQVTLAVIIDQLIRGPINNTIIWFATAITITIMILVLLITPSIPCEVPHCPQPTPIPTEEATPTVEPTPTPTSTLTPVPTATPYPPPGNSCAVELRVNLPSSAYKQLVDENFIPIDDRLEMALPDLRAGDTVYVVRYLNGHVEIWFPPTEWLTTVSPGSEYGEFVFIDGGVQYQYAPIPMNCDLRYPP